MLKGSFVEYYLCVVYMLLIMYCTWEWDWLSSDDVNFFKWKIVILLDIVKIYKYRSTRCIWRSWASSRVMVFSWQLLYDDRVSIRQNLFGCKVII